MTIIFADFSNANCVIGGWNKFMSGLRTMKGVVRHGRNMTLAGSTSGRLRCPINRRLPGIIIIFATRQNAAWASMSITIENTKVIASYKCNTRFIPSTWYCFGAMSLSKESRRDYYKRSLYFGSYLQITAVSSSDVYSIARSSNNSRLNSLVHMIVLVRTARKHTCLRVHRIQITQCPCWFSILLIERYKLCYRKTRENTAQNTTP